MTDKKKSLISIKRPKKRKKGTGKFKRLKAMDCYPEVHELLAQGYPASHVAAVVQNKYGEYKDIEHTTITTMLNDYFRNEIPASEKVANQLPAKFEETISDFGESVNVLKEYTHLFNLQKDRINVAMDKERELGHLMKSTAREIKTAAELLDRIYKVQDNEGMRPDFIGDLHARAGVALNATQNGVDGKFLMSTSKKNSIVNFIHALENTDPNLVQIAMAGGTAEDIEGESEDDDVIDVESESNHDD